MTIPKNKKNSVRQQLKMTFMEHTHPSAPSVPEPSIVPGPLNRKRSATRQAVTPSVAIRFNR